MWWIDFINSYPVWVRVAVFVLLILIGGLLVFFRGADKTDETHDYSHLGLSDFDVRLLRVLAEPHRGEIPRTEYLAYRLETHEQNVRHSAKALEERGLVWLIANYHDGVDDPQYYSVLIHDAGKEFLAEHRLLD